MKILLIGATGQIGGQTLKELQLRGISPRIGARKPEKAKEKLAAALEYVPFDFERPDTFEPALSGVSRLFFIAPLKNPNEPVSRLLEKAQKSGLRHITFSSGRTTGDVEGAPLNQVEKLVAASGIPYTIIRPGWFMQNFAAWLSGTLRSEGKLYLPAGDAKTAFVDVRDIAAVVAQTLLQTNHEGRVYNLTSDEALDHHEVVAYISRASGKPMSYIPLERSDFIQTMVERGWTEAAAAYTANLYEYVRAGKEEAISSDIGKLLRRKPIRFAQFARDYRETW